MVIPSILSTSVTTIQEEMINIQQEMVVDIILTITMTAKAIYIQNNRRMGNNMQDNGSHDIIHVSQLKFMY